MDKTTFQIDMPQLHESLQLAARIFDERGDRLCPIELYHADYEKLRKAGITHWGLHPLTSGRMKRGRRQKKAQEALL